VRIASAGSDRNIEALFIALGDPSRRRIFFALMEGEKSVSELAGPLAITLTGMGQHIKVLEGAHLVTTRKVGRERLCSVNPQGLTTLEEFAKLQRNMWKARFGALRRLVEGP
jgi:DNA-binding transcriptional ArsR family regulator